MTLPLPQEAAFSLDQVDAGDGAHLEVPAKSNIVPSRIELSKNFSIISMEDIPQAVDEDRTAFLSRQRFP